MIALTFIVYQPLVTCSACGSLNAKYVDHCILWSPANADIRHRTWLGFWHRYGVDMYLCLAICSHYHLIDFFFDRYDIIADVINIPDKNALYCYIARFIILLLKSYILRW